MQRAKRLRERLSDSNRKLEEHTKRLQDAEAAVTALLRYKLSAKAKHKLRELLRIIHIPTILEVMDRIARDCLNPVIVTQFEKESRFAKLIARKPGVKGRRFRIPLRLH